MKNLENFCRLNLSLDVGFLDDMLLPLHRSVARPQKYAKNQIGMLAPVDVMLVQGRAREYVVGQLPQRVLQHEIPDVSVFEMTGVAGEFSLVGAHIDIGRVSAINYHIDTNGEHTVFCDWDGENISPATSFKAQNNESWMLDVTVPHYITLKPGKTRRILTIGFKKTDYQTLRRMCASKVYK